MAAPIILRTLHLLRRRLSQHHDRHLRLTNASTPLRPICSVGGHHRLNWIPFTAPEPGFISKPVKDPPHYPSVDNPDFINRRDKEAEILDDIEPILSLTKEILHSDRYKDGEPLTPDDVKAVVDKLLAHHPHSEDKIGCGLDYIMVDRHPQFKYSRCLFVVRTDGACVDFSYHKCLRAYIQDKYPSYADKFIKSHFKSWRS